MPHKKGTPEYEAKMSAARMGTPAWNKGRKGVYSKETLEKMSLSASNDLKQRFSKMSSERKFELTQKARDSQLYKNTSIERFVESILIKDKIRYEKQKQIGRFRVDFYLPDKNLIIEVNGCFHHQCELCGQNKGYNGKSAQYHREKDVSRINFLKSKGYEVKILWQHDLKKMMKETNFER